MTDSTDRGRAEGFGTVADLYDRARPSYPAALVAELLAGGPVDILDVGCGTGRAALLLAGPGRRILGVEPDPRMAGVARSHGVTVEEGRFETWPAGDRRFDLVVSGQAWHWVDPVAGAGRAAAVLRPGGRFAAFWNVMHHGPAMTEIFARVYGALAPGLLATSVALGVDATVAGRADPAAAALAAAGFHGVTPGRRRAFEWTAAYTPAQWVDLVATHSDHRSLPPAVLAELLDELDRGLRSLGAPVTVGFRTDLLAARRP